MSNPIVDSGYETIQSLLDEHLSRNTPVLMVLDANLLTETLVGLRKVNLIAFRNSESQSLLLSEIHRITNSLNTVSCNSHILLQVSDIRKNDAQQTLLTLVLIIRKPFDLVLVAEDDEFALCTTCCS